MHMKTGVEQSVYAIVLLSLLPERAVLPGEAIAGQLGASPTYFHKLLRKLVQADLIVSVPGAKGGFRLKREPEEIRVYDVYKAIEGQQTLYASSGIMCDLLELKPKEPCCLLSDLMDEAESAWKSVLKRETIASIAAAFYQDCYTNRLVELQNWLEQRMVR